MRDKLTRLVHTVLYLGTVSTSHVWGGKERESRYHESQRLVLYGVNAWDGMVCFGEISSEQPPRARAPRTESERRAGYFGKHVTTGIPPMPEVLVSGIPRFASRARHLDFLEATQNTKQRS